MVSQPPTLVSCVNCLHVPLEQTPEDCCFVVSLINLVATPPAAYHTYYIYYIYYIYKNQKPSQIYRALQVRSRVCRHGLGGLFAAGGRRPCSTAQRAGDGGAMGSGLQRWVLGTTVDPIGVVSLWATCHGSPDLGHRPQLRLVLLCCCVGFWSTCFSFCWGCFLEESYLSVVIAKGSDRNSFHSLTLSKATAN